MYTPFMCTYEKKNYKIFNAHAQNTIIYVHAYDIFKILYVHVTIYLFINTENFTTHSSPIVMSILYCITYQYCYGYFKDKGSKYRRFSHELIFILCILHLRIKMCSYFCLFGELSKKLFTWYLEIGPQIFFTNTQYSFYSRLLLTQCQPWFFFFWWGGERQNKFLFIKMYSNILCYEKFKKIKGDIMFHEIVEL